MGRVQCFVFPCALLRWKLVIVDDARESIRKRGDCHFAQNQDMPCTPSFRFQSGHVPLLTWFSKDRKNPKLAAPASSMLQDLLPVDKENHP
jgi:hypothetical protein